MKPRKTDVTWLPIDALMVDERVQRAIVGARLKYLTKTFDPDRVGIVEVSLRSDGRYYVIDGQHRVLAARESGHGKMRVKCHVHRDLTLEGEAERFLSSNDQRAPTPIDKYKVGLVAQEPVALGIDRVLRDFGLEVGHHSSDGVVRCVDQLRTIYRTDPELLRETLSVATEAWGTRSDALERVVLAGLSTVLGRYNGELDRPALVKKLAKRSGGAAGLVGDARGLAAIRGVAKNKALAEIVRDTYNKGRRSGELAPL